MWRAGAIRIARFGSITVDVHPTIGLAIWGGLWGGWMLYGGLWGAAYGVLAIFLLFVCLLVHELAHGVLARRLGLAVSRITFLPIGILIEIPSASPYQEILIALAGPFANLGISLALQMFAYHLMPLTSLSLRGLMGILLTPGPAGMLLYLTSMNACLGLFNMIPAFPMDGGRVLRAGLALAVDYVLATRIAAWLGRILAIVMGLTSLIGFPIAGLPPEPALAIVSAIVFLGAHQEELYVRQQRALVHMTVKDMYQRAPEIMSPWDTVTRPLVVRLFKHEKVLPIVVEDRVVGLLTYQETRDSLEQEDTVTIAHVMRTDFPVLRLQDTLWAALRVMNGCQLGTLPVVHEGLFQGVISLDDIDRAWRFFPLQREGGNRQHRSGDMPQ